MALLKIAQIGEPVLREIASRITPEILAEPATQQFIDDLIETMYDANGAGIAANQVYRPIQICVIETKPNNPRYPYKPAIPLTVMVNPKITPVGDEVFNNIEGCLSVPNLRGLVKRHAKIKLEYLDRDGLEQQATFVGVSAGTFQHECDHLSGKLFVDSISDVGSLSTIANFDRYHAEKCSREAEAIVKRYGG